VLQVGEAVRAGRSGDDISINRALFNKLLDTFSLAPLFEANDP